MSDNPHVVIYQCSRCRYMGIVHIEENISNLNCTLCGCVVGSSEFIGRAHSEAEAQLIIRRTLNTRRVGHRLKVRRGLGVKRRVYSIIESQIELNGGRPTTVNAVVQECIDAGIDAERVSHFLTVLEDEGLLSVHAGSVRLSGVGRL